MQNRVSLTGRLTHDIEVKTFDNGGKVANFSLAVQRNFKNKNGEYDCDFINCQANNQTADLLFKYFKKGQFVVADGEIRTRKFQTDNGENRTVTFVNVQSITFVGGKNDSPTNTQMEDPAGFMEAAPEDDDFPF